MLTAGVTLALAAGVCHANVDEAIAHCAAIEAKDDRIVCLESALRALDPDHGVARRAAAPAAEPDVVAEPKPALEPAPLPEPIAPPADAEVRSHSSIEPVEQPRSGETEAGSAAAELGSEQVAARHDPGGDEAALVNATVVDFDFVGYRRLLVQLDNGQIWRQIDGDRISVERALRNADSFHVEMWETGLGGYRMRILPLDRTIRVERLQ